jgi:hypothetical protein
VKTRGPLIVGVFLLLVGAGMTFGAYATYRDQHSGTPGKARVASCTGRTGRYGGGIHCSGTWVTGGSLLDGGRVVFGHIENAGRSDIGDTVDVRIHGGDHATIPNIRVTIILALLGIPMVGLGGYLLAFRRL